MRPLLQRSAAGSPQWSNEILPYAAVGDTLH
jgi:hypothetical protein